MTKTPDTTDTAVLSGHDRLALRGAMEYIQEALRGLQFGEVTVTVQDGVAVQVERTERKRVHGGARKR